MLRDLTRKSCQTCKVSETFLETRFGLTTPKKLLQPEPKSQALQKDIIDVILNKAGTLVSIGPEDETCI